MDTKKTLIYISLSLCFLGLSQGNNCPEQCQCIRGKWTCSKQNLTEWTLKDLLLKGDPTTVKELDLKNNLITNFPSSAFVNFTKLEEINLAGNLLTKPPKNISNFIPSLKILELNKNLISSISREDFQGYGSINHLDIFENNISEILPYTFRNLPELRKLFAEGNSLEVLQKDAFAGLDKLVWVTFQGNQIEHMDSSVFDNIPGLERVWLGNNRLKSIPVGLFKNSSLTILDLKQNQLTDKGISPDTFSTDSVNLSQNNLTTLRKEWFSSATITYEINVSDNPILCDCALYETYRA